MGLYDVVRFEGVNNDWLIYKYPSDAFNTRSKVIVSTAQIAIIVHNGKIEKIWESGTFSLNTELLPIIKGLNKSIHSGKNPYPIEIYYINKRLKLDFLWGTKDPIDVIDPVYGIKLRIRARGQFGVRITDYQYFLQTLVGSLLKDNYITFGVLRDYFRGFINQKIKKIIAVELVSKKITYFEIGVHVDEIQELLQEEITKELNKFGFEVASLSIENIDAPEEDLDKLNDILHKKAELNQLGDNAYRTVRGYDVLEAGAKGNGTASTFMGVGLGTQMGGAVGGAGFIPPVQQSAANEGIACPKCGAKIDANSKFCPECGTKILNKCPKCGADVTPKQRFCPECGQKLYE